MAWPWFITDGVWHFDNLNLELTRTNQSQVFQSVLLWLNWPISFSGPVRKVKCYAEEQTLNTKITVIYAWSLSICIITKLHDHIHNITRIQLKAVFVVYHHFLHRLYTFDKDVIHVSDQSLNLKNPKMAIFNLYRHDVCFRFQLDVSTECWFQAMLF